MPCEPDERCLCWASTYLMILRFLNAQAFIGASFRPSMYILRGNAGLGSVVQSLYTRSIG